MPLEPTARVNQSVVFKLRSTSEALVKAIERGDLLKADYYARQINRLVHHSVCLNHEAGSF